MAYISVSEAYDAKITYASIVNRYGNTVQPTTDAIQDAMNAKVDQFTDRLVVKE